MAKQATISGAGPSTVVSAHLGFEDKLWAAADKLRGNMDAAEYKHVVLGLIFLKYISDAFMEKFNALKADDLADPEDKDEYLADNNFWVPPEARWDYLQKNAKRPEIGTLIDDAMAAIERDNRPLKGVLPKDYARPALDKARLGEIIDLIATIGLGDQRSRQQDILGRVYEYFLARFAAAEGKLGGQFYTPQCVVRTLIEMLEPYKGRVFDPCCGCGMFVQAAKFVQARASSNGNGRKAKISPTVRREISIHGQESNYTTWRLALMNLAIRGIDARIEWGDSFLADKFSDIKADYILANPPINMEDWGYSKVRNDVRWRRFDQASGNAHFALPPGGERKQKDGSFITVDGGNANYAWILHFLHHLAPHGTAGFVLANGSLTSNTSGEGDIRRAIIEADMADCVVALPGQLFYTTQIPACLWFLSGKSQFKEGEILFGKLRPYFHKVGIAPVDGVCSTDILVVVPKSAEWHSYVLSLVSSKTFVDYTDSHSAGTKMPRTNWNDMGRYPLALPPESLAKAFQDHVAGLHQRIGLAVRQNRRLAGLRDTLLPKLLSGEVEVPAAEALVEGVA